MWERHIYECLLICGFRRWELGVRLLTVLVPIAVGFIIQISRFNQLMRYIQTCEKFPRQIIITIRVIICNIRISLSLFHSLDLICISHLIKTINDIDLVMVVVHEKLFLSLPSFKGICILTFLNSCKKKWNMILTPKCCTSYLFSETNINMKQRRNETSPFVIIILFTRFDMYFLSY